jgi:hypothetical protein
MTVHRHEAPVFAYHDRQASAKRWISRRSSATEAGRSREVRAWCRSTGHQIIVAAIQERKALNNKNL